MHQISKIRSYAGSGIHKRWELASSSTFGMEIWKWETAALVLCCLPGHGICASGHHSQRWRKTLSAETQLEDGVRADRGQSHPGESSLTTRLCLTPAHVSWAPVAPTGMVSATFLGKHWSVKPSCDCHCIAARVPWLSLDDGLDFTFPQTSPEGTWAFVQLQSHIPAHFPGSSGCSCLLPRDAEILHHTLHFDVALAQGGCSPPAMLRVKPWSEMPSPGRVRTDSTAFVLPPLHFSLPVAIIAHQHRLTIAQASPQNKWNRGWGPILVSGALPLTLNGIGI